MNRMTHVSLGVDLLTPENGDGRIMVSVFPTW